VGSLAYSWTVGNVHFVQLNNYPTYTTSWSNFRSDRARRIKVEIKEALTWLENDLIDARNLGRAIVINMHDAHEHFAQGPDRQRFIDMIEKYGVSAIFAGHIHESLGRGTPVGTVPMFYCGSSAYSKYLAVSFFDNEMTLQGVDSSSADEPGYVKLGSWVRGSLDRQALNTTVPATPFPPVPKDGRVTFFNEGGYVARFTLTYQLDGKQVKHETGNLALGNKRTYNIPGRATGVRAVGECKTGLIWNPWANIFNVSYSPPPTVCLKAYGTTLSPKYNTNCD
jgi:cytolysin (calcineurin-like family phosphatase)